MARFVLASPGMYNCKVSQLKKIDLTSLVPELKDEAALDPDDTAYNAGIGGVKSGINSRISTHCGNGTELFKCNGEDPGDLECTKIIR